MARAPLSVCTLLTLGVLGVLVAAGCKDECKDEDGDGHGEHCERGDDCDDSDAKLNIRCDAQARACDEGSYEPGCPCLSGSRRDCYSGTPETLGVAACVAGRQSCSSSSAWLLCQDEVAPVLEQCNGDDDDCDGLVDEGVLSPCGGCDLECSGGVWGGPTVPFEAQGELDLTSAGELTLRLHDIESLAVWVPNTGEGTLSKVDALSAQEVARYRVAGETPERVAVDYLGDAWVLSPSLEGISQLTKVAGDLERCVDRDDDGEIRTSQAFDDVLPDGADECVLLTMPIGESGAVARALATDGIRAPDAEGGRVWVGLQASERLLQLDGATAELLREVPTPGLSPYAAAFDPWGTLWVIDRQGHLGSVVPSVEPAEVSILEAPLACYELEALASDARGILTLTGSACEQVVFYDPSRDRWQDVKTPGVHDARGVAILSDASFITHTGGSVSRATREPLEFSDTWSLDSDDFSPLESIAIGADSRAQLWVVSSLGAPDERGVLTRMDPEMGEATAQVPLGRLPRGQGDITGDRRLGQFAPEASITHVFDGCGFETLDPDAERISMPSEWLRLHVAYTAGEGASVEVEARRADNREVLDDATWTPLGTLPDAAPPYELAFEVGGVIEVRLTLRVAGRLGAPRIARVGLEWTCVGPD